MFHLAVPRSCLWEHKQSVHSILFIPSFEEPFYLSNERLMAQTENNLIYLAIIPAFNESSTTTTLDQHVLSKLRVLIEFNFFVNMCD